MKVENMMSKKDFVRHLVITACGSQIQTIDFEEVFGEDKSNFDLEIMINGHKIDANSFITSLEENYEHWYEGKLARFKKSVREYVENTLAPTEKCVNLESELSGLLEGVTALKNKIESVDTNFSWDEKLIEEMLK